jgi:predicted phage tail protein
VVLRDNYFSSIGSGVLDSITKHFGKSNSEEMFINNGGSESFQIKETKKVDYGNRTEDKFDNDIIPTTKIVGMIGSVIIGILMFFNGSWIGGLLYAVGGVMATLGLCVLLEGISTIIKLLRKISEK